MTRRKRFIIEVTLCVSLITIGFTTAGYSQQGSETSKTPKVQKQPVERQPFQNRFQWQVGLEVIADLRADRDFPIRVNVQRPLPSRGVFHEQGNDCAIQVPPKR